jgi:hypothetical protein
MNEPKPLASLSSNLLARKGQAAPAMRRQGMVSLMTEATASGVADSAELEDLGWNDMGHDSDYTPGQAGRAGLSPMAASHEHAADVQPQVAPISAKVDLEHVETSVPEVVLQQRALERETAAPVQPAPQPVAAPAPVFAAPEPEVAAPVFMPKPAPRVANRAAPGSRGKAAFTLRLDADRHLQLRLACALGHRSAQQIVTEALDAYLGSLPITEQLAAIRTTGKA